MLKVVIAIGISMLVLGGVLVVLSVLSHKTDQCTINPSCWRVRHAAVVRS
jgi:hypothetical protein